MTIPANAPALLVQDSSNGATATVSAELVSADGRAPFSPPVKDTHGLLIAALPKVSVGSHTISSKVGCSNESPETVQETPLTVTERVELPTVVGTLAVRPSATPNGIEKIALDASPGLRAFRSVTVVDVSVNGVSLTGSLGRQGGFSEEFSLNTGSACIENGALHREKRTLRVSFAAHIAGVAQSPEPATLDITVDCGAIKWTTASDFDGSGSTPSSSEPDGSNSGSSSSNASGCSAAPGGLTSGSSAVLSVSALALLAGLRRRRAR